ncbi:MAG: hypothetical protein IJS45_04075 [Clostridia bacterium]|nr:hypothetical protein [Clostridia bacterium]
MKNYFFGRYFKCCGKDGTVAFIPAYHRAAGVTTASLQIITDSASFCVPFSSEEYRDLKDGFGVGLGRSSFTKEGLTLDLEGDGVSMRGHIGFGSFSPIKGDIMGPFRFVPFMECRHSVYSMIHELSGSVLINGKTYDMNGGAGYIEGDRGYSFPREYAWTHTFFEGGSLMLSVAEIPVGFLRFTGIIGFVFINGKEYRIATYKRARTVCIKDGEIEIKQGKLRFSAKLIEKAAHPLSAPSAGAMIRTIRESASCRAAYKLSVNGETLLEFCTGSASFEYEFGQ